MTMQWFIKPTGKSSDLVEKLIISELIRRGMNIENFTVVDKQGDQHIVYEITPDMLNFLKNHRVSQGINFRVFSKNLDSSVLVTEDRYIYKKKKKIPKKIRKTLSSLEHNKKSKI